MLHENYKLWWNEKSHDQFSSTIYSIYRLLFTWLHFHAWPIISVLKFDASCLLRFFRLGVFYCPMLPAIAVIKCIIIFYIKKASIHHNPCPCPCIYFLFRSMTSSKFKLKGHSMSREPIGDTRPLPNKLEKIYGAVCNGKTWFPKIISEFGVHPSPRYGISKNGLLNHIVISSLFSDLCFHFQ